MRSFIAVKISSHQREKIAALISTFRRTQARVKWVHPENLHATLKFLGEVNEADLPEIYDALEKSLTNDQSFAFNLSGLGCFPNAKRPRVIWIGIQRGAPELRQMASKIDSLMSRFGFEKEKRGFSPHLTIGRVKDDRGIDEVTGQLDLIKFETDECIIDEVIFFQSILKREGPTYIPQKIVKLKPSDKEG